MHKAYFDILREQLNSDPPEYKQALVLLEDVKQVRHILPSYIQLFSHGDLAQVAPCRASPTIENKSHYAIVQELIFWEKLIGFYFISKYFY